MHRVASTGAASVLVMIVSSGREGSAGALAAVTVQRDCSIPLSSFPILSQNDVDTPLRIATLYAELVEQPARMPLFAFRHRPAISLLTRGAVESMIHTTHAHPYKDHARLSSSTGEDAAAGGGQDEGGREREQERESGERQE